MSALIIEGEAAVAFYERMAHVDSCTDETCASCAKRRRVLAEAREVYARVSAQMAASKT